MILPTFFTPGKCCILDIYFLLNKYKPSMVVAVINFESDTGVMTF